jgi:hypothetical protein
MPAASAPLRRRGFPGRCLSRPRPPVAFLRILGGKLPSARFLLIRPWKRARRFRRVRSGLPVAHGREGSVPRSRGLDSGREGVLCWRASPRPSPPRRDRQISGRSPETVSGGPGTVSKCRPPGSAVQPGRGAGAKFHAWFPASAEGARPGRNRSRASWQNDRPSATLATLAGGGAKLDPAPPLPCPKGAFRNPAFRGASFGASPESGPATQLAQVKYRGAESGLP